MLIYIIREHPRVWNTSTSCLLRGQTNWTKTKNFYKMICEIIGNDIEAHVDVNNAQYDC